MLRSIFESIPGRPEPQKLKDIEKRDMAGAFFSRLANQGLSDQQLFARIMQDSAAFEHAVSIRKLHELIPELGAFEDNPKDPNIYRPMPVMRPMLESIRQTFGWVGHFGAEEYKDGESKGCGQDASPPLAEGPKPGRADQGHVQKREYSRDVHGVLQPDPGRKQEFI